jgi:crossover junction endodeoxyribonuclease RuvC
MVDCGVIAVAEKRPLSERLQDIFQALTTLLEEHAPDAAFLESIFHHKSARSALVLGHARGVAMLACGVRALPLEEISPSEVKKAVTGRGRAEKAQVQEMIRVLLGLPEVPQEDASDALAVALAGAGRTRFAAALSAAAPAPRPARRGRRK